jgi:frataxin-like iron-binding protein CyaY
VLTKTNPVEIEINLASKMGGEFFFGGGSRSDRWVNNRQCEKLMS